MTDLVVLIISWFLSMLVFDFVFDKLNYKYNLFKEMQSKVNNLGEKIKNTLRFICTILIMVIFVSMVRNEVSNIAQGLVTGLLFSFRDRIFDKNWGTQV